MNRERTGKLWSYGVALTTPLFLFTLLWLAPAWQSIRSFVVLQPSIDQFVQVGSNYFLERRLRFLLEEVRWTVLGTFGLMPNSLLPIYNLEVAPEHLARINEHLPGSGRQWVPARLTMPDGAHYKTKARLRGDSMHHWGFESKSWRVRFNSQQYVNGERRMDFSVPRRISSGSYYLPLRMAQEMHLLAPTPQFVEFHLNGRPRGGTHLLTETVDEGFLRRRNRLPGDIYLGDFVLRDAFPRELGVGPGMWSLPKGWIKAAHNNKFVEDSRKPLEKLFVRLAASDTVEGHRSLKQLLDIEAWARLAAWLQLTGGTHFDYWHNWVLYFDEGRQQFEPIVRDGNALGDNLEELATGNPSLDSSVTSPIMMQLHLDHEFLRLKERAIVEFLNAGKDHILRRELDRVGQDVAQTLRRSPQVNWAELRLNETSLSQLDGEAFLSQLEKHQKLLGWWFEKQRDRHRLDASNLKIAVVSSDTLRLRMDGYAAVGAIEIPLTAGAAAVRACLRYRVEGAVESCEAIDRYVIVRDGRARIALPLLAGRRLGRAQQRGPVIFREIDAVPATYDIVLEGADLQRDGQVIIEGLGTERIALSQVDIFPVEDLPADTRDVVPYRSPATYWAGEIRISENTDIPGDLFAAAGTHVRIDPNVTITVHGRLMLQGNEDAPVTIDRADPAHPWGTLVVLGPGADGSRLRYCKIAGGSGQQGDFHLYSGMLEIRNMRDLEIDSCQFRDNVNFDDMLHFAYVEGVVRNTHVANAVSDCIDLDISNVRFENVTIAGCGNDGLDLMTSKVFVKSSDISGAGDKGISIGEKTLLRVEDTTFRGNEIGVQGKDASQVHIRRSRFIANKVQVAGYHKNERYVGDVLIVLDDVDISGKANEVFQLKEDSGVIVRGGNHPAVKADHVFVDPPPGSLVMARGNSLVEYLSILNSQLPSPIR